MKKCFASMVALLLVFGITACSDPVNGNNPETESVITTHNSTSTEAPKNHETVLSDNTTEKSSDKVPVEISTENSKTTDKTEIKIPATKEPVSTKTPVSTKETTTKVQTPSAPIIKLPLYAPQPEIIALFNKINNYRTQNNLNELTFDSSLCKMAYIRATEQNNLKGHTRPDDSEYYSILDEYNYEYSGCGENIAFGENVSVDSTFDRWENSEAHNRNMLEPRWTKAGMAMHLNLDGSYNIVILFAC